MYHLELRQFPHNTWRFNLDAEELQTIVTLWVRGQPVDVGERRWSPLQARLTILEGPALAMDQLTMGRGWRAAERDGRDVTERVLADARASVAGEQPGGGAPAAAQAAPGDPFALGVQLASLLGPHAPLLLERWRALAAGAPELAPSESLARAEHELRDSQAGRG